MVIRGGRAALGALQEYAPDDLARQQVGEAAETVRKAGGGAVRDAVATFGAEALKARLGLR